MSLAPNDEMANLGLGLSFQGLDELKEAQKWVVKSLKLKVDNPPAIYTLLRIAQELDHFDECERVLIQYLELHPHDHNMLYTLGGILFRNKRYEEAIDAMNKIIKINPLDGRAQSLIKQSKRALERVAETSVG